MVSVYIVWGSTYLAIRFAVDTIPPFLMASTRFLIAGGFLFLWRYLSGDRRPTRVEWRSAAIAGTLLLLGGNGLVSWAEQHVASGIAALLVGSAPLWMVLIDGLILRRGTGKWFSKLTIAGVVIGFLGIAILVSPAKIIGLGEEVDLVGGMALTLAAVFWSIGSLYSRSAPLPSSPLLGTSMEMISGGIALAIVGSLAGDWSRLDLQAISLYSLLGLGYLILFGSLVGFVAYTWLLRVAPTPLVSTYAYVNPLVAIIVGNLLASEPLTPRVLVAAAVIIGAVSIISLTQPLSRRQKRPEVVATLSGED
jgi:drug/metabolite transporter (DMT)-like permease